MTEVVAALIWDGDRFLACQRPAHKDRALLWEFVGGKVEPGETGQEALVRECREELGITVSVGNVFTEVTHTYPDLTIHLTLYHASVAAGRPMLLEHNAMKWVTTAEMDELPFCPADTVILDRLRAYDRTSHILSQLEKDLFSLRDEQYRSFHCRLMPSVDPETVIGVRMPALRAFARDFEKAGNSVPFMDVLPHRYYEENNLHGALISAMKDFDRAVEALDRFLPYVDNWATCDMISPRVFRKHLPDLLPHVHRWISSDHTYTIRFGLGMLMKFYLDDAFSPEYLDWAAGVRSEEYYVNMMTAWYFATALAKQHDAALPFFQTPHLAPWTHNKAIQKAIESDRIPREEKEYLRSLKLKKD